MQSPDVTQRNSVDVQLRAPTIQTVLLLALIISHYVPQLAGSSDPSAQSERICHDALLLR